MQLSVIQLIHLFGYYGSEAALAHVIENKAEAAYRRGDLFDKRRKLMEAWAVYCGAPKAGKIVALRR
jgi:hypothetical protein